MGNETIAQTTPDKSLIKEFGRRRVFAFFFVLLLAAIANTATLENDIFLHVIDDYADIAIAIVAIILIAAWRNKTSLGDLRKLNNILAVLAVLIILATIFAFTQEYNDPEDFGNEIPTMIFGIFSLVNRFV